MDFLKFFGLNEDPFKLTPDPSYFYPSASHNEGLLLMEYSIDQREGFLLVIGDPGTGKTTLLKVFLEKWKDRAETAIVLTPRLSPEEFLFAVAEDFNINLDNKNKNEIIRALRDFMTKKSSEGKRVIIIVDEAQNLPDETLEELRLLSNLETDKAKLLQIMLIGQPELEAKLQTQGLRQLNQRIITRVHLCHFSEEETLDYIKYRAIKAGKENLQIHRKAARGAYQLSNGVPRLINMLVSRALMAAYIEESNRILPRHIDHAVKSLNHSELVRGKNHWIMPVAAGIAAAMIAIFSYFYFAGTLSTEPGHEQKTAPVRQEAHTQMKTLSYEGEQARADVRKSARLLNDKENKKNITANTMETIEPLPPEPASQPEQESIVASADEQHAVDGNSSFRFVSVNVDVAIVRTNPSITAHVVGWSAKGSQLLVLDELKDERNITWYQITHQGEKRWISGEVVDLVSLNMTSYN